MLDGGQWIISGQTVWTTQVQHAGYRFLLTRTDRAPEQAGFSHVLVPMEQDQVAVRGITEPDCTAEYREVFFDNAAAQKDGVGGERVLGLGTGAHAPGRASLLVGSDAAERHIREGGEDQRDRFGAGSRIGRPVAEIIAERAQVTDQFAEFVASEL